MNKRDTFANHFIDISLNLFQNKDDHLTKLYDFKLTFVSILFVQTLAFDRSIFVSFIGFFMFASTSLSVDFSAVALLGQDCFRRPDDDLELSF